MADVPGMDIFEAAMGKLVSSITDVSGKFEALAAPVAKFVEALSPGTMQVYSQALRDLTATIGVGFLPIIQNLTAALHQAAGILMPTMYQLQETFGKLSEVMISLLMPGVQLLSHGLAGLKPILDAFADVMKVVSDVVTSISVIFLSLKDALGAFLSSLLGGQGGALSTAFETIKNAVQKLAVVLLQAAASIANSFGNKGFTEALIKTLRELTDPKQGVGGAAQNIQTKGLDQFSKDLSLAAASAVEGGAGRKSNDDYIREALAALEDIQKNGTTIGQFITNFWPNFVKSVQLGVGQAYSAIKGTVTEAGNKAADIGKAAGRAAATVFLPKWMRGGD